MAKWYSEAVDLYLAKAALQVHGSFGCMVDYDVQRFYGDGKIVEICQGSKVLERAVTAREVLKRVS